MRITRLLTSFGLSALLLAALALGGTQAAAQPHLVDKSHSQITFMVDHLGFSAIHGQFREFDAQVDFNPDRVEEARVRFTIKADSVETFWPARDEHLRSPDFFNTEVYPEIMFESTAVVPTGSDTARIQGNLTMVGQTRPLSLEAKLNAMGPSPFNPGLTIAGFTVTGVIDRTDFGLDFAAPAVGAAVPIRIDLEISPAS